MSDNRAAVLVPGRSGGMSAPWARFARVAVETRGARVHTIEWQPPDSLFTRPETAPGWVREQVEPVLDEVGAEADTVLVGKSLGSQAAAVAAERGLPAVWVTPLLNLPGVVAALEAATAPFLLVGGTADWAWDPDVVHNLTPHVWQIERADHGLFRPAEPLAASADVLGQLGTAIENFLDEVVWRP